MPFGAGGLSACLSAYCLIRLGWCVKGGVGKEGTIRGRGKIRMVPFPHWPLLEDQYTAVTARVGSEVQQVRRGGTIRGRGRGERQLVEQIVAPEEGL